MQVGRVSIWILVYFGNADGLLSSVFDWQVCVVCFVFLMRKIERPYERKMVFFFPVCVLNTLGSTMMNTKQLEKKKKKIISTFVETKAIGTWLLGHSEPENLTPHRPRFENHFLNSEMGSMTAWSANYCIADIPDAWSQGCSKNDFHFVSQVEKRDRRLSRW